MTKLIQPNGLVIDAGSHKGEFALEVCNAMNCRVVAFEPNVGLWQPHANSKNPEFRAAALGGKSGKAHFHFSDQPECSSLLDDVPDESSVEEISVISFDDLSQEFDSEIDCLKLDIEGAECGLLLEATPTALKRCRQITVEFHDFMYPHLADPVRQCIERLDALGFSHVSMCMRTHEDVLFVRRDCVERERISMNWIGSYEKYLRGVSRRLKRLAKA